MYFFESQRITLMSPSSSRLRVLRTLRHRSGCLPAALHSTSWSVESSANEQERIEVWRPSVCMHLEAREEATGWRRSTPSCANRAPGSTLRTRAPRRCRAGVSQGAGDVAEDDSGALSPNPRRIHHSSTYVYVRQWNWIRKRSPRMAAE